MSLCPSITETVWALGAWDRLVGRTRYCVHPEALVGNVPHVRGTKNPDLARIGELQPDLVLANTEENRAEDIAALRASGYAVAESLPKSVDDTIAWVRQLGVQVGEAEAGERLAAELAAARAELPVVAPGARRSFAYLIWREPWMVAGADTFISSLLGEAGPDNAFADRPERYPEVTDAELAAARPEVILLSSEPYPFAEKHRAEVATAAGTGASRVRLVDGELLCWAGWRTLEGLAYAASLARDLGVS